MKHEIDPRDFRTAAGQFMTGVTIVTTIDADGLPSGLTANSFVSVSLDPPLVQFSLGRSSTNIDAFEAGNGYVVHVLSAQQQDLSMRFAAKGIDRFEGSHWRPGHNGLPVLADSLATFECSPWATYEGGDHLIYIGKVERLTIGDGEEAALGYFRGRYFTSRD